MKDQETEQTVMIECLVCGAHSRVCEEKFHGHETCGSCHDTTNHVVVASDEEETAA